MTQPLEISVLSAPLAAIDRRTISQAWYSALRFARSGSYSAPTERSGRSGTPSSNRCSPVPSARSAVEGRYKSTFLEERSFEIRIPRSPKKLECLRLERRNDPSAPVTRRAESSALAACIERRLAARSRRVTLQLGGEGRVHLMLQKTGSRMCIIAICSKRVEARVARAIDEARYALAARGVLVDSSVKGVRSCR